MTLTELPRFVAARHQQRHCLVTIATEGLWVGSQATYEDVSDALRYFIGGIRDEELMRTVGALMRGQSLHLPERFRGTAVPDSVEPLVSPIPHLASVDWSDQGRAYLSGRLVAGAGRDRLSPIALVATTSVQLSKGAEISVISADSRCPEPTLELAEGPTLRPILRSVTAGTDFSETRARALGEAAERYLMGSLSRAALRWSAADDLPGPYFDPSESVRYSTAQCQRLGIVAFSADEPDWWVRGIDLGQQESETWIPAALVFAPFPINPGWATRGVQSSNGVAFHHTRVKAIENAWLELAERDAFIRTWRIPGYPIAEVPKNLQPKEVRAVIRWIVRSQPGRRAIAGRLTAAKVVPVWIVAATGPDIGICLGTSAGQMASSLLKAACECFVQVMTPSESLVPPQAVRTPTDHRSYFRHGARYHAADRLFDSAISEPYGRNPVLEDLRPTGLCVEFAPVRSIRGSAVRVIDPSFLMMTFGYDAELLGAFRSEPGTLAGVDGRTDLAEPHPFP